MRDTKRIKKVCTALEKIWSTVPDWRLMQLIVNLQDYTKSDCFYLEDEDFVKVLADMTGVDIEELE